MVEMREFDCPKPDKTLLFKNTKNRNENRRITKNQTLQTSGDSTGRFLGLRVPYFKTCMWKTSQTK